jgi:sRNA-binding carbon storage regulator CsrA
MYIIERKLLQSVVVGDPAGEHACILTVLSSKNGKCRIGFTAPHTVPLWRFEALSDPSFPALTEHLHALQKPFG